MQIPLKIFSKSLQQEVLAFLKSHKSHTHSLVDCLNALKKELAKRSQHLDGTQWLVFPNPLQEPYPVTHELNEEEFKKVWRLFLEGASDQFSQHIKMLWWMSKPLNSKLRPKCLVLKNYDSCLALPLYEICKPIEHFMDVKLKHILENYPDKDHHIAYIQALLKFIADVDRDLPILYKTYEGHWPIYVKHCEDDRDYLAQAKMRKINKALVARYLKS